MSAFFQFYRFFTSLKTFYRVKLCFTEVHRADQNLSRQCEDICESSQVLEKTTQKRKSSIISWRPPNKLEIRYEPRTMVELNV